MSALSDADVERLRVLYSTLQGEQPTIIQAGKDIADCFRHGFSHLPDYDLGMVLFSVVQSIEHIQEQTEYMPCPVLQLAMLVTTSAGMDLTALEWMEMS